MSALPRLDATQEAQAQPLIQRYQPPANLRERIMAPLLRAAMRFGVKPFFGPPWPFAVQRLAIGAGARLMPQDRRAVVTHERIGALPVERIRPRDAQATQHVILYLHGGGFIAGSPRTHRPITRRLCALTGATVIVPDYRLGPEARFPAQIDDALMCYQALLAEGWRGEQIVVAGDSAGGSLTYMLSAIAAQKGWPQPAGLVMISPALQFDAMLHATDHPKSAADPVIRLSLAESVMAALQVPMSHPWADPMKQDLSSLPPTLLQVGEDEVLYDSADWLVREATAAGRPIEMEVYMKRWHVFHVHAGLLPSADRALMRIAEFMQRQWAA
ncbi:alpha/beta hydrolase [Aquabacterium sp.]|uniref:alpha/beta hydrolase n=1 Tax=Aquabacterium sp. TaxID=1872578 RepID=UPI003B7177E1